MEMVTITKAGEPQKLTILLAHLEEHQKLGWRECDPDHEELGEFNIETATAAQMRTFLTENGIEFGKKDFAATLRDLCAGVQPKE